MLMILYIGPITIERYHIISKEEYFLNECDAKVEKLLNIPVGNSSYNNGQPDAAWYCNVMEFCGFPLEKDLRNTIACPLYSLFNMTEVPSNEVSALCLNTNGQDCDVHNWFSDAKSYMNKAWKDDMLKEYKPVLSFLFNAFIFLQLFNEICCRRINDEYDFFAGLLRSKIFMAVIVITCALQAIIINFLGKFFKVLKMDFDPREIGFTHGGR
jgi:Ca2+-transporting ATPase